MDPQKQDLRNMREGRTLACTECRKSGWKTEKLGEKCRWSYHGTMCPGTMANVVKSPREEGSDQRKE